MKKLSRSAYEDTKGFLRVAETLLEVAILAVIYYCIWRREYDSANFAYKGKYVLMGVYGVLTYIFFQNADCAKFGQLNRMDLIIGQIIALGLVNFVTYFQLSLIANRMLHIGPMLKIYGIQIVVAIVLILIYTTLYQKMYAPHDMLLIFGHSRGVELKIKMDSRRDKYNIRKLISVEEGLEAVCAEARKYDAVIINDVPAQMRNDILKYC